MIGPLHRTRNLLLVNLRGTGNSTPLNCPGLEHAGQRQNGRHFNSLVGACGRRLNHTWRYRGGGWVHASDLFNTAYSARDVSAVVRALRLGRVDLYGDSYGSWFSQAFASRYPGQLRSVALDSTYQVLGLDPWYTSTVITARRAFAQACARWTACSAATGAGRAWRRIAELAARLARAPVTGETTTADGTSGRLTVTAETLVNLVNNAGFDPVVYRDLDAAGRALLRRRDAAPLLRLDPRALPHENTSCARRVTPIHTVGSYPRRLAGAVPATPAPGNTAGRLARQAATVALASVGDEVSRWPLLSGDRDRGPLAGKVTFTAGRFIRIRLHGVRWVTNATIGGTARWDPATGQVTARLAIRPTGRAVVRLTAHWQALGPRDRPAVIHGSQAGRRLVATCPAP